MSADDTPLLARRFARSKAKRRKQRPIIVCGMPRSGTLMTKRFLVASPDIVVTNEYPAHLLLLARMNETGLLRTFEARRDDAWLRRFRRRYWRWHWVEASPPSIQQRAKTARRFGNKTPSAEYSFEVYEQAFAGREPLYIYCARAPLMVLRSLKNMPWNSRSVHANWERYKRSFCTLARIVNHAPERVLMVRVDQLERPRDYARLGRSIFRFVGEPITPELAARFRRQKPAHPMGQILQKTPSQELTAEEEARVRSDPFFDRLERLLDGELSPADAVHGLRPQLTLASLATSVGDSFDRISREPIANQLASIAKRLG